MRQGAQDLEPVCSCFEVGEGDAQAGFGLFVALFAAEDE